MSELREHNGPIEEEEPLGYEGADAPRVYERASYEAPAEDADAEEARELAVPADDAALEAYEVSEEIVPVDELEDSAEPSKKKGIDPKKAAGAAGAAVVLAASLGTAQVATDQVTLPEPVPIVQTLKIDSDVAPPDDAAAVDEQDEKRSANWLLFLKILKYALIALIAVLALIFALVKGCASCTVPFLAPGDDQKQEQQEEQGQQDQQDQNAQAKLWQDVVHAV